MGTGTLAAHSGYRFSPGFPCHVVGQLTERAAEGSMGIDISFLELVVLMFRFLLSFFIPSPNSRRERIDTVDPGRCMNSTMRPGVAAFLQKLNLEAPAL